MISRVAQLRWLVVGGCVLTLEVLCRTGIIAPQVVVAPSIMFSTLIEMILSGEVTTNFESTFYSALTAILISVMLGISGGLLLWRVSRLRRVLEPVLAAYYSVPVFVFYPILIALFGMNDMPIIVNALNGFDRIPLVYLKAAQTYKLSAWQVTYLIRIPAALPQMMTGFKLTVAYSFIGVIAAEFILSTSGLGYAIAYAYNNFETRAMYALMLLIMIVVSIINVCLMSIEKKLLTRRGVI
jgi:NitT/TauT family transport system permease protein